MANSTVVRFSMPAFIPLKTHKYELFILFLFIYIITIVLNTLLITVIYKEKSLHQPMNILSCVLAVNEIYGSTALLPPIMVVLLSKTSEVAVKWCMAQVYFLHTYSATEFCILAAMGYDRYVAICQPLHYHTIMSNSGVCKLVALAILYPFLLFSSFYSLTLQLKFCGKTLPKLHCVNMDLVKNACSVLPYISIIGLVLILLFIVPQFVMLVFSYMQIAKVCRKLNKESQANALKTCMPHLVSLLNFTVGVMFEIIQSRLNMSHLALGTQLFLSLHFGVTSTTTNPLLYGLGTQMVRIQIFKLFIRYKILPAKTTAAMTAA